MNKTNFLYCNSLTSYERRVSRIVNIGGVPMGGHHPIRIQSMTTVDTMDTRGSVDQIKRIVDSGCDYVRLTAPSLKEAQNLQEIKKMMNLEGINVPLIADIHFTPNAAELAARIVEKVRVNPGNYADKKKFQTIEYSNSEYEQELDRIRQKFIPLIKICKEYGTAMRIGTNHGSLSDRIMSRYGDTPNGMVESALEFLRICEDEGYYEVVLSMKASNPQVMIHAYRLLVQRLQEEKLQPYPLHLGVTEAGEGEDGRIKSALGIGTLLEDGLGDTVRVSLTEEPEFEAPVARTLVARYNDRKNHESIPPISSDSTKYDPFHYHPRSTFEINNIGGENVPRVIADMSHLTSVEVKTLKNIGHFYLPEPDKWSMNDQGADYIYTGNHPVNFMLPNGLKEIVNSSIWNEMTSKERAFPFFTLEEWSKTQSKSETLNFVEVNVNDQRVIKSTTFDSSVVIVAVCSNEHAFASYRQFFDFLQLHSINNPVIIKRRYQVSTEDYQLYASTDIGGLFSDGFGNGITLGGEEVKFNNQLSFGILQASRTRISKTEYISCPSCGRTLFDLQQTTAMIRKQTDHLKGLKIGIMGCIVNGPGEMADADYGYVGSGVGKITLYRGQEVVKRNVPSLQAVDELIGIIREDGRWNEPDNELKDHE